MSEFHSKANATRRSIDGYHIHDGAQAVMDSWRLQIEAGRMWEAQYLDSDLDTDSDLTFLITVAAGTTESHLIFDVRADDGVRVHLFENPTRGGDTPTLVSLAEVNHNRVVGGGDASLTIQRYTSAPRSDITALGSDLDYHWDETARTQVFSSGDIASQDWLLANNQEYLLTVRPDADNAIVHTHILWYTTPTDA